MAAALAVASALASAVLAEDGRQRWWRLRRRKTAEALAVTLEVGGVEAAGGFVGGGCTVAASRLVVVDG